MVYKGAVLEVSPDGEKIYYANQLLKQHIVKPKYAKKGFKVVSVAGKKLYVHRIVAMLYLNDEKKGDICLHKDTNTLNNHFSNLCWGTKADIPLNMKRAKRPFGGNPGHRFKSKIKNEDIPAVKNRLLKGDSVKQIAADYQTSETSVRRLIQSIKTKDPDFNL